ncbi:UNVERIFIED_CONTAM: hypothetical protein FKN15_028531 [Acipenser sinensis]
MWPRRSGSCWSAIAVCRGSITKHRESGRGTGALEERGTFHFINYSEAFASLIFGL